MTAIPEQSPSAICVWHATSSSSEPGPVEQVCERWLDDSDRRRASLFRRPTTRNQHVIGRGMARKLLGSDLVEPNVIRFGAEVHGKPFVTSPDVVKRPFNVAHTDGLVMCGIGDETTELVGIDVERLDRRTDPELADRYFSKPEVEYLHGYASDQARRDAFLRIWTLKESFIKAIGTGLQTPLADFAFEDIDSETPRIRMLTPNLESDREWRFFSIQPRPGFIGAIAVAAKEPRRQIDIELRSFDELVT